MDAVNKIRHYLLEDADGVTRHLEDFVSVPAFIYRLQEDNYLSISKSIIKTLNLPDEGISFRSFIERMRQEDALKILSIYASDVPAMMRHRENEPLPRLRGFDFSILDGNKRWRHGVVKLDIAGYDANGVPDKLFGIFLLDDVPIEKVEGVYEKSVDEALGRTLAEKIHSVQKEVRRLTRKKRSLATPVITQQEKRLIHGLAKGFSTREIAAQMNLSVYTVEGYRKALLRKFNARNTVQMVLKAGHINPDLLSETPPDSGG